MSEALGLGAAVLLLQLIRQLLHAIDGIGHTPPGSVEPLGVALAVDSEGCAITALDQEIPALVAIGAPRLNRQGNCAVFVVSVLV